MLIKFLNEKLHYDIQNINTIEIFQIYKKELKLLKLKIKNKTIKALIYLSNQQCLQCFRPKIYQYLVKNLQCFQLNIIQ